MALVVWETTWLSYFEACPKLAACITAPLGASRLSLCHIRFICHSPRFLPDKKHKLRWLAVREADQPRNSEFEFGNKVFAGDL